MVPSLVFSDAFYANVLMMAGRLADFDPQAASPLAAIKHTHAHVLLMHGEMDMVIPVTDSVRLHAAAPQTTALHILSARGHLIAPFDFLGEAKDASQRWFGEFLSNGC